MNLTQGKEILKFHWIFSEKSVLEDFTLEALKDFNKCADTCESRPILLGSRVWNCESDDDDDEPLLGKWSYWESHEYPMWHRSETHGQQHRSKCQNKGDLKSNGEMGNIALVAKTSGRILVFSFDIMTIVYAHDRNIYGSVSAGRGKWPFCVTFFKK